MFSCLLKVAALLIGYMRVSKRDGSQRLDLQRDSLPEAGVVAERIYEDLASGRKDARPGIQPNGALVKVVKT